MNMPENAPLHERYKYAPQTINPQDIQDALEELEAWRSMAEDKNIYEGPKEMEALIDDLESRQENPDHADYDDLKSFFEDCVGSLNKHWPCAEAYDTNLRQVIMEAITRGDVEEEQE